VSSAPKENSNLPRHFAEPKKGEINHSQHNGYSIQNSSTFSTRRKQALLYTAHEDQRGLGGDGKHKDMGIRGLGAPMKLAEITKSGRNNKTKQMATTMRWV
jgi:hypothetical protein